MLKILLIEDEPLAMEQLEEMVLLWDKKCQIVGKVESLEESTSWFTKNEWPDIIISDIQLSDGLSLDLFSKGVPDQTKIVFTTAFDQYAIEAFKIQAQDYLLKPIDKNDLFSVLDKIKEQKLTPVSIDYHALADLITQKMKAKNKVFLIRFKNQLLDINSKDIAFITIENRLVLFYTFDGRKLPADDSLDQLENELDNSIFFRANRKCIINHKAINKIKSYSNSKLLIETKPTFPDDELIVSKEKSPVFKAWLIQRDQY
jgi:DNA-binding LytR/AlgR family response regulator